jgi:hypothetical protein
MFDKSKMLQAVKESYSYDELTKKLLGYSNGKVVKQVRNFVYKNKIDISHFDAKIKRRLYKTVEKECPICGTKFTTKLGHPKEKKTCSCSCSNTMFRSGDNNGNFTTGEGSYKEICFRNFEHKCLICDERKVLDTHHLDGNRQNNDKKNLIPLCPTHHRYMHSEFKAEIEEKINEKLNNIWV